MIIRILFLQPSLIDPGEILIPLLPLQPGFSLVRGIPVRQGFHIEYMISVFGLRYQTAGAVFQCVEHIIDILAISGKDLIRRHRVVGRILQIVVGCQKGRILLHIILGRVDQCIVSLNRLVILFLLLFTAHGHQHTVGFLCIGREIQIEKCGLSRHLI